MSRAITAGSALEERVLDRASCRCHLCGGVVSLGTLLLMGDTCAPCCWGRSPGAWTPALPFDAGESWYLITTGLREAVAPPRPTAPMS